jgi:tetratricopeptide (TPR) repeat protein
LRLDPASGAAYQALAQLEAQGHFAEREALHNKALAVAPNDPIVLLKVALFLSEVGRIGDALEHMKHAYRLDPMSPLVANWYGNLLDFSGRFEEGTAFWKKVCLLWPDNELIVFNALYFAANKAEWGRFDELAAAARARGLSTTQLLNALAYGDSMRDRSKAALAGALPQARDTMARTGAPPLLDFSRLYRLGLTDEVFELVDQATFAHMFDPDLPSPDGILNAGNIFNVAYNEAMMRDVRFVRLCAKRGLVAYWVETGRWPDCADAVAPWYDFRAEARRLAAA